MNGVFVCAQNFRQSATCSHLDQASVIDRNMALHAFTVDVEDWFHLLDCPQMPGPEDYHLYESRVENNVAKILRILDEYSVKATFFILGWTAEAYPHIAKRIANAGHEIGIHGFAHVLASELSDSELEKDTRHAFEIVANAAGVQPVGYRSPGGSLMSGQRWMFDLILDLGMKFDASIYPRAGGLAEEEGMPVDPYIIHRRGNQVLWEYPSTVKMYFGVRWAYAEGGYLRLLPLSLVRRWIREREQQGKVVIGCVHPREFDPRHPMLNVSLKKRWMTQVGLTVMEKKVRALLCEFDFGPIGDLDLRSPDHLPGPLI